MNVKELRKAMIDRDITSAELAKLLNVTPSAVSNKLNGGANFTLSQVQRIVDLFDLSEEETFKIFFAEKIH